MGSILERDARKERPEVGDAEFAEMACKTWRLLVAMQKVSEPVEDAPRARAAKARRRL